MNQDGFFDLIVGAPGDDNNGSASGSARVYSLVPQGVFHVGTGTPGCAGPQLLGTNGDPFVGNAAFEIVGNHAPSSSLGLLLAADALNPVGWDPFGLGATFYIDFFSMSFLYGWDYPSDAHGSSALVVPIPNDANIVGLAVVFQSLSVWSTPCGLGPFGISTSMAAVAFLQP